MLGIRFSFLRAIDNPLLAKEIASRHIEALNSPENLVLRNHYKHFTGREYGKQEYYHLAVDSAMLGTDGSVELIMNAIRTWCDVRGTHPLSVV